MTPSDKLREIAELYLRDEIKVDKLSPIQYEGIMRAFENVINEHYVAKEEVDKMVGERLREYHLNEGYDVVIVGNPDKEIDGDIFEDIKVAALELGELRGLKVMITGFYANYLKSREK